MASQTVKTPFAMRVHTCAQAMRACLIRLRDRGHAHPATGGAGLSAAGIDAGAVAKSTTNVRFLYRNGACTSTDAAGGESRHYAKGVSPGSTAKGALNKGSQRRYCLPSIHFVTSIAWELNALDGGNVSKLAFIT